MARESLTKRRERCREIVRRLKAEYPDSKCSLDFGTPFQLLIAVILSAQCTDERVNEVTPRLFARWPDPVSLAAAPREAVEEVVRPTGFYRNKAKNIQGAAQVIHEEFHDRVPDNMTDLLKVPGAARKTANVVLHVIYGGGTDDADTGVVVDTHVTRVANRLKLLPKQMKDAVQIERELVKVVDREDWGVFTHLVIDHGRAVCLGRTTPKCDRCVLAELCPSAFRI